MNPATSRVNNGDTHMIGKFAQTTPAPPPAAAPTYAAPAPATQFAAPAPAPAPAAMPPQYAPPPAAPASRWAGIQSAQPRDPLLNAGAYRLRLVSLVYGFNPGSNTESSKATFEVIASEGAEANTPGEQGAVINLLSGKAGMQGMPRTKALVMAIAGASTDAEYNAFDPDGAFIDAAHGRANHRSAEAAALIGRLVDCRVTRGNAVKDEQGNPTADYYRNHHWFVVPEDQQPR